MAEAPAAPAEQPAGEGQPAAMLRMMTPLLMLVAFNLMSGKHSKENAAANAAAGTGAVAKVNQFRPLFPKGQEVDFRVYVTHHQFWDKSDFKTEEPVWEEHDVIFDSTLDPSGRNKTLKIPVDDYLILNGTLWAHVFVSKAGYPLSHDDENFDRHAVVHAAHCLMKFREKVTKKVKKLLEPEKPDEEAGTALAILTNETVWRGYMKPTLSFCLVEDWNTYTEGSLPEQIASKIKFDRNVGGYYPVLFINEFWTLTDHLVEINATMPDKELSLFMSHDPIGLFKWQMIVQMEEQHKTQSAMGMATFEEHDMLKRMLLDTNPWLLALTAVVSILHMLFDFLAFKNDISFWKNKKDIKGLSVKTIILNVVCQLIIFLYLLDNETSRMILVSCGIGVVIEAWKIKKACNITVDRSGRFPKLHFEDNATYTSETAEYDNMAMKWLGLAAVPLLIGYAIYSLIYNEHKGWYSFIINTLVGAIYAFGFIMMTPQLFINYKLKSVAHLPWRTFMYKAMNTFIDDLFAFIITMPTLHRLSCFRDDLIFFIYLYQRWKYPVDHTRVNEFGQGGEEEAAAGTVEGAETDAAPADADTPTTAEGVTDKKEDGEDAPPTTDGGVHPDLRQRKGKAKLDDVD